MVGDRRVAENQELAVHHRQRLGARNIDPTSPSGRGGFQVEAETLLDAQHKIQANRALVAKFHRPTLASPILLFTPINIEEV
jgi:hypothetical protein